MPLHGFIIRLFNTPWGRRLLRWFFKPKGLFLCYPDAPRPRQPAPIDWTPKIIGFARQGGSHTLVFGVSGTESDFTAPQNRPQLASVVQHMKQQASYFGAIQVSYAGVLPAVLQADHLVAQESSELTVVCCAIFDAVGKILQSHTGWLNGLVVLGGSGAVSQQLVRMLNDSDAVGATNVLSVDSGDPLPSHGAYLFVNCTAAGAIDHWMDRFPAGSIVLNGAYPAPNRRTQHILSERGIALFHITGVQGFAWPRWPNGLNHAIPCSAALVSEPIEVVLTSLQIDTASFAARLSQALSEGCAAAQ